MVTGSRMSEPCGGGVATDFSGVLDESGRQLGHGQLKGHGANWTVALIPFQHAADFGGPVGQEITDSEIEGFRLSVGASRKAFASHKILKSTSVEAKGLRTPLARDHVGGGEDGVKQRVMESKESTSEGPSLLYGHLMLIILVRFHQILLEKAHC